MIFQFIDLGEPHVKSPFKDFIPTVSTGVELFIGSKYQCMFCVAICSPEGREGGKGGSANFRIRRTEPLTREITPPLYIGLSDSSSNNTI